jgi:aspartate kinase
MKVFKFGGASVKDAEGVRNVARVLKHFPEDDLLIVVSAMGKTTNALEEVVWGWQAGKDVSNLIRILERDHLLVQMEVAPNDHRTIETLKKGFDLLRIKTAEKPSTEPDRDYDQIVGNGEHWSTLIVSSYLNATGILNRWLGAATVIQTDRTFRQARVDWDKTARYAKVAFRWIRSGAASPLRIVTQGFIGAHGDHDVTTLGREGSDFSAAIFAYLLDAESVTIWKDVAGMFNADPKRFAETVLLEHISYREAIELSYFGASVIHPRTLQPLQKKNIPLYVRSFLELSTTGSTISEATEHDALVPSFSVTPMQLLISITPHVLSFIVEENLSGIFRLFAERNVRIDLMQNSAVAFSVAVEDTPRSRTLIDELRREYEVLYNEGCELVTVRHFDEATLTKLTVGKEILIEQRSRSTARFVLK